MVRRVTIRLISLLLVANGIAGIAAVWVGWSMATDLLTTLRQTSSSVSAQQARLVEIRVEDLDGDFPPKDVVHGPVDGSHAAPADHRTHLVTVV